MVDSLAKPNGYLGDMSGKIYALRKAIENAPTSIISRYLLAKVYIIDSALDDDPDGFEKFLSTVYMRYLRGADQRGGFCPAHYFRPCGKNYGQTAEDAGATMGRVYRNVLFPFAQGAMALMNLINPLLPCEYGEGWLGFFREQWLPDSGWVDSADGKRHINYLHNRQREDRAGKARGLVPNKCRVSAGAVSSPGK